MIFSPFSFLDNLFSLFLPNCEAQWPSSPIWVGWSMYGRSSQLRFPTCKLTNLTWMDDSWQSQIFLRDTSYKKKLDDGLNSRVEKFYISESWKLANLIQAFVDRTLGNLAQSWHQQIFSTGGPPPQNHHTRNQAIRPQNYIAKRLDGSMESCSRSSFMRTSINLRCWHPHDPLTAVIRKLLIQ